MARSKEKRLPRALDRLRPTRSLRSLAAAYAASRIDSHRPNAVATGSVTTRASTFSSLMPGTAATGTIGASRCADITMPRSTRIPGRAALSAARSSRPSSTCTTGRTSTTSRSCRTRPRSSPRGARPVGRPSTLAKMATLSSERSTGARAAARVGFIGGSASVLVRSLTRARSRRRARDLLVVHRRGERSARAADETSVGRTSAGHSHSGWRARAGRRADSTRMRG